MFKPLKRKRLGKRKKRLPGAVVLFLDYISL